MNYKIHAFENNIHLLLDLFVQWLDERIGLKPHPNPLDHKCSASCQFKQADNVYICAFTGNVHLCGLKVCDSIIQHHENMVCSITCQIMALEVKIPTTTSGSEQDSRSNRWTHPMSFNALTVVSMPQVSPPPKGYGWSIDALCHYILYPYLMKWNRSLLTSPSSSSLDLSIVHEKIKSFVFPTSPEHTNHKKRSRSIKPIIGPSKNKRQKVTVKKTKSVRVKKETNNSEEQVKNLLYELLFSNERQNLQQTYDSVHTTERPLVHIIGKPTSLREFVMQKQKVQQPQQRMIRKPNEKELNSGLINQIASICKQTFKKKVTGHYPFIYHCLAVLDLMIDGLYTIVNKQGTKQRICIVPRIDFIYETLPRSTDLGCFGYNYNKFMSAKKLFKTSKGDKGDKGAALLYES